MYSNLEKLLVKAATGQCFDDEFEAVMKVYGSDFDSSLLKTQLCIMESRLKSEKTITLSTIKEFITTLGEARSLLSEVVKLVSLVLVMPATNATSERSFSALRRVKTYLRGSMKQSRLNHLMVLHVHRELTDNLDLIACSNDFVVNNEHRFRVFGKFC